MNGSRLALLTLVAALAASAAAAEPAPPGKSHALLVGVRDYAAETFGPLEYTENDVEELARLLDRPGSPWQGNVRLLTSTRGKKKAADAPTAENIRKAVAALVRGKTRHDTVLIALAGHGVQLEVRDSQGKQPPRSYGYFCPSDADLPGADFTTGRHKRLLLLSDLLADLADCGARGKLLLVDACRDERAARSLRLHRELVPAGVAALFSCKPGQTAFETAKLGKGHGVFFHFVLAGLRGEARGRTGDVTWNSLADYVVVQVAQQTPRLIGGGAQQMPHEIKNLAALPPVLLPAGLLGKPTDTTVSTVQVRSRQLEMARIDMELKLARRDEEKLLAATARATVEVRLLDKQVADAQKALETRQARLKALQALLAGAGDSLTYNGKRYSRADLEKQLHADTRAYQAAQEVVRSKEKLLAARRDALARSKAHLQKRRQARTELTAYLEKLKAELAELRAGKAPARIDPAAYEKLRRQLDALRGQLEVETARRALERPIDR